MEPDLRMSSPAPTEEAPRRASELTRLEALLRDARPGLAICSISGPGGVGKSYLLTRALELARPEAHGWLQLRVDGSNASLRTDFFGVLEQLFPRGLSQGDATFDHFSRLRAVAQAHRDLSDDVVEELSQTGASEATRAAVATALKTARLLNRAIPPVSRADSDAMTEATFEAVQKLKAFSARRGLVRRALGLSLLDRVRRELFAVTAESIVIDLQAALKGLKGRRRLLNFALGRLDGVDKLLLVIDDYEALAPVLEEFLIGSLVPALAASGLTCVMLVLGRDELEVTHSGWAQQCRRWLTEPLRLQPFDEPTARALLREAGVPEARAQELYAATQGYPFLLSLVIEEAGAPGGGSALFLRRFFERTTRWMTPTEADWFVRVCYLERVNHDTLARLFPPEQVAAVQQWFEKEPSIRDPQAADFVVRPLIREKVLRYQAVRSPSQHAELSARAAAAP